MVNANNIVPGMKIRGFGTVVKIQVNTTDCRIEFAEQRPLLGFWSNAIICPLHMHFAVEE